MKAPWRGFLLNLANGDGELNEARLGKPCH
jgi:hypothetical protein